VPRELSRPKRRCARGSRPTIERMNDSLSRRELLAAGGASMFLGFGGCATAPSPVDAAVVSALAPSGRLRASINYGNPVLARRDPVTGEPSGVSVDLARSLAAQLGVAVELKTVESAGRSVEAVKAGQADVGFFAIDPLRSDGIRFTAPYVLIEGAYLVRNDSSLAANDEVDRAGTRVVVGQDSVYDLWLTRELKAARIERASTSPVVVDEFLARRADVAAGVKQQLLADAARLGGLRILPGHFMVIEQAMGLPTARGDAAAAALAAFVERAKASGFVAGSLARQGISGALVAPAAG
jgi:polar amino acid transport system substrate-binding protein